MHTAMQSYIQRLQLGLLGQRARGGGPFVMRAERSRSAVVCMSTWLYDKVLCWRCGLVGVGTLRLRPSAGWFGPVPHLLHSGEAARVVAQLGCRHGVLQYIPLRAEG